MRFTHEALLKIVKETVDKRFSHDPNVTAVFLIGSMRPDHVVVENAADVDLLVLHNGELPRDREIVKLSNDFHLDITYEGLCVSNLSSVKSIEHTGVISSKHPHFGFSSPASAGTSSGQRSAAVPIFINESSC